MVVAMALFGGGAGGLGSFFRFLSSFLVVGQEEKEGCRRNREGGRLQGGSISKMRSIEEMEGLLSQEDRVFYGALNICG